MSHLKSTPKKYEDLHEDIKAQIARTYPNLLAPNRWKWQFDYAEGKWITTI